MLSNSLIPRSLIQYTHTLPSYWGPAKGLGMRLPGNEPNVSILESKSVLPSFSIAVYPCVSVSLVIVADSSLHLHSHTVCFMAAGYNQSDCPDANEIV